MSKLTRANELGMVVIGASAGGVVALREFLYALPESFKVPIVVVQHLPRGPRLNFEMVYGERPGSTFREAEDKLVPRPGDIVMAIPDYHLAFEKNGILSLSQDVPVNFSRPSIDILFESAAYAYGSGVAGVLMSGANQDGARGLLAIHRARGLTLVQDPHEAENAAMPKAAIALFQPTLVAGVRGLAEVLVQRTQASLEGPGAAL